MRPNRCADCNGPVVMLRRPNATGIRHWWVCETCGGATTRKGKFVPRGKYLPGEGPVPALPDKVVVWQNDAVMVFDKWGEQVDWAQGSFENVWRDLAKLVPVARWEYAQWPGTIPTGENWMRRRPQRG